MIDPVGLELFMEDSIDDVRRKWENTYIRIRDRAESQWTPFLIRRLVSSPANRFSFEGYGISRTGESKQITIDPFVPELEVLTTYPSPTLTMVDNNLMYCYQRASRQWRLGVTERNLGSEVLLKTTAEFLDPLHEQGNTPFHLQMYHLFNPKYQGVDALRAVWEGDDYAGVFNHEIWCGFDLRYNAPVIGLINQPIGELMNGEGDVRLFEAFEYLSKPLSKTGIRVV